MVWYSKNLNQTSSNIQNSHIRVFCQNQEFLWIIVCLCNGLWLLPLNHTYLKMDIFWRFFRTQKLGGFNLHEDRQQNVHARSYIPTTDWLGVCDIFPAWAFVLLIVERQPGLEFRIKLMQRRHCVGVAGFCRKNATFNSCIVLI